MKNYVGVATNRNDGAFQIGDPSEWPGVGRQANQRRTTLVERDDQYV
jgi:hypothetical protein